MNLYPMITVPVFHSGTETPWGGTMLSDAFLKDAPEGPVGESLETCADGCMIGNGECTAMLLSKVIALAGAGLTGMESEVFPLDIRLIDVADCLETVPEGDTVWMLLNAEAGSSLLIDGQVVPLRPGSVFFLPAGTRCAIRGSLQLYAATGSAGTALPAKAGLNEGTTVLTRGGSVTWYACSASLAFCRLNLDGRMPLESGCLRILMATAPCKLHWGAQSMDLMPFTTVLIPAALEDVVLEGRAKLLQAALPQQEVLRSVLGYRAGNVAGL